MSIRRPAPSVCCELLSEVLLEDAFADDWLLSCTLSEVFPESAEVSAEDGPAVPELFVVCCTVLSVICCAVLPTPERAP